MDHERPLAILGVWAGSGGACMASVGQPGDSHIPLLRLVLKRLRARKHSYPTFVLLPWSREFDWMEQEIKDRWGCPLRRCHPDERVAMRDLVAEFQARVGVWVNGCSGELDVAEINLGIARVRDGKWENYLSTRIKVRSEVQWLSVSDDDEWPSHMDTRGLSLFYAGENAETVNARALRMRREAQSPDQRPQGSGPGSSGAEAH
jgi:hypothetical protein